MYIGGAKIQVKKREKGKIREINEAS